ncbi:MAG: hypothetical protein GXO26_02840 [Crenarchaeota archaeon]|nr:hypothetical protein [Thermoproteota archaeon]
MVTLSTLGKFVLYFPIFYSLVITAISVVFLAIGLPPPVQIANTPLFTEIFKKAWDAVATYGYIPQSLAGAVYSATFFTILLSFAIPFSSMLMTLTKLMGAPYYIVLGAWIVGLFLDAARYIYILSKLLGLGAPPL